MSSRSSRTLAITLALGLLLVAAKPDLDPSNSGWNFPSLAFNSKGKAKKLGKAKSTSVDSAQLTLGSETGEAPTSGSFSIAVSGELLTGTYTRKNRRSRKALLTFDALSGAKLANLEEASLEADLASKGFNINIELAWVPEKSKLAVKLASKKKTGLTTAKVKAAMSFVGTATGEGVANAPTKVKLKLKGESDPVDSALIEVVR